MFKHEFKVNSQKALSKGLKVAFNFFETLVPIEYLLLNVHYPTVIATGTRDKYSSPSYVEYLHSLVKGKDNFLFRIVDGAPHEVTYDFTGWKDYCDALFL